MAEDRRRPTPDHPPYGEMISMAIMTLKEERGSTTASIDCFIRSKYKEELLPPAHSNLFPYHLNKLILLGELQQPTPNTYIVTPDDNIPPNPNPNSNPFPPSSPAVTSKPPVKEPRKKRRRLNPSPPLPPSAPTPTPTTDPDPEPLPPPPPPPPVIHPHSSATASLTPPSPPLPSATATLTPCPPLPSATATLTPCPPLPSATATLAPTAECKWRGRPPRQKPEDQEKEAAAASAAKGEEDVPRLRGRSLMAEKGTGTESQQRKGMRRR